MVELPDLTRSPRQAPRPSSGIARMQTQTGFENIPAQAMRQVAGELKGFGETVFRVKEQQDTLIAEEAYNNLLQKKSELEFGENGYTAVTGSGAIKPEFRPKYNEQFNAAIEDISSGLYNENQRQMFQRRANLASTAFNNGLLRHSADESMRFAQVTADTTIKTAIADIASNPENWQANALRAMKVLETADLQTGQPPEATAIKKQAIADDVFSALVSGAVMSGDIDGAVAYYEQSLDGASIGDTSYKISAEAKQAIYPALKKATDEYVMDEVQTIAGDMQKAIRAGEDPQDFINRVEEVAANPLITEKERSEITTQVSKFALMEGKTAPAVNAIRDGDTLGSLQLMESLQLETPAEVSVEEWNKHLDQITGEISDVIGAKASSRKAEDEAVKVGLATQRSEIQTRAAAGDITQQELQDAFEQNIIQSQEEFIKLDQMRLKARQSANEVELISQRVLGNNAIVVSTESLNKYYDKYVSGLADSDKVLFVDRMKAVPTGLKREIDSYLMSGDPNLAARAAIVIDAIDEIPGMPETFSPNNRAFAERIVSLGQNMTPAESVKLAQQLTDPRDKARIEARQEAFKELQEGYYGEGFDVDAVIERGLLGMIEVPPSSVNHAEMQKEYKALVESHFLAGMDIDASKETAARIMRRNWKQQEFLGRTEAFKYPLVDYYSVDGSIEYAEQQLLQDVREGMFFEKPPGKDDIYLLSDKRTAEEAATGNPSYLIYVMQDGMFIVTGQRFRPDVQEGIQQRDERLELLRQEKVAGQREKDGRAARIKSTLAERAS